MSHLALERHRDERREETVMDPGAELEAIMRVESPVGLENRLE